MESAQDISANDKASAYIAQPSGRCCLQGSLHDGEPRGRFSRVADIDTYIASPSEDKSNGNILLYFADVWGMFKNSLLIMDAFADAGYLVLGLDYFRGDPVYKHRKNKNDKETDPGFDFEAWKTKHMDFATEAVPRWAQEVRDKYGKDETKYACVGYCFGAPFVCDQLASNLTSVGAFAHPAFLKDHHFQNLKGPLFLSCAETDHTFGNDARNKAVNIMQEGRKDYQLQLFSGVEHGFALRGNMDNPYERYVKEQSLKCIIEWFDHWLT